MALEERVRGALCLAEGPHQILTLAVRRGLEERPRLEERLRLEKRPRPAERPLLWPPLRGLAERPLLLPPPWSLAERPVLLPLLGGLAEWGKKAPSNRKGLRA